MKETNIFHGLTSYLTNELKAQHEVNISNLVIRSWCVALSHVTDCPKGKVDVVAIRALPIIITPRS
jgi:hypothetical protein